MNSSRLACCQAVERAIRHVEHEARSLCLLFIDIDRFASLNHTFGRDAGDRMLLAIEQRIGRCLEPEESVFRLQGDEFVILSPRVAAAQDTEALASRVASTISEPLHLEGLPQLQYTASIGIALFPDDARSADELMERAELVMSGLKERGRNAYARFRVGLIEPSYTFLSLDHRIYHGLEHGEFHLYFAPIIDIRTGRLVAMEALTRWAHPELGLLAPPRFLADPTSAIALRIEEGMLFAACLQGMTWLQCGLHLPRMAMNVSARSVLDAGFPARLQDIFARTGFSAERFQLEITESDVTEIGEDGYRALRFIADRGVRIAVERFGAGASSLKRLKRFPVTMLKLDRAFACDASSPKSQAVLASAIIASAHGAGYTVVVEGVETQAQLDFLRAEGCDAVQGSLAGRPLAAGEATAFLETFDAGRLAHMRS